MLKKLEVLEDKYKELTEKISDPEIINDQKTWQKYMKVQRVHKCVTKHS